jgi:hypothetical protein
MIAEALRRLQLIAPLNRYTYVGFGALHFMDFTLFHRILGITDMVSIEKDEMHRARYAFNRPFRTVDLHFGRARDVLPQLEWDGLRIVWLDYDEQLTMEVLSDVQYVIHKLLPGSVLIVTVNGHARLGERLNELTTNVGEEAVEPGLSENDLTPHWAFAEQQYAILAQKAQDAVEARSDSASVKQVFNFRYRDAARMQTVGWVVVAPNVEQTIDSCKFDSLDFVRGNGTAYDITVPALTRREIEHLVQLVPTADPGSVDWLDEDDFASFASLYRWYPQPLHI